jgi:hypothetical protein
MGTITITEIDVPIADGGSTTSNRPGIRNVAFSRMLAGLPPLPRTNPTAKLSGCALGGAAKLTVPLAFAVALMDAERVSPGSTYFF